MPVYEETANNLHRELSHKEKESEIRNLIVKRNGTTPVSVFLLYLSLRACLKS